MPCIWRKFLRGQFLRLVLCSERHCMKHIVIDFSVVCVFVNCDLIAFYYSCVCGSLLSPCTRDFVFSAPYRTKMCQKCVSVEGKIGSGAPFFLISAVWFWGGGSIHWHISFEESCEAEKRNGTNSCNYYIASVDYPCWITMQWVRTERISEEALKNLIYLV